MENKRTLVDVKERASSKTKKHIPISDDKKVWPQQYAAFSKTWTRIATQSNNQQHKKHALKHIKSHTETQSNT